jgi:hypothetical protein
VLRLSNPLAGAGASVPAGDRLVITGATQGTLRRDFDGVRIALFVDTVGGIGEG